MGHLYLSENINPRPGEARAAVLFAERPPERPEGGTDWQPLVRLAETVAPPAVGLAGAGDLAPSAVDEPALFRLLTDYLAAAPGNASRLAAFLSEVIGRPRATAASRTFSSSSSSGDPQGELARLAEGKVIDGSALSLADAYRQASREHPALYESARAASFLRDVPQGPSR